MLNFRKHKVLQILEYCFPNIYFRKYLFAASILQQNYSFHSMFHCYRQFADLLNPV